MTTEDELNLKIAEWVFGKENIEVAERFDGSQIIYHRTRWIEEDKEWDIKVVESFTDPDLGIAHLFKLAIPKCTEKGWYLTIKTHTYWLPEGTRETVPGFLIKVVTEGDLVIEEEKAHTWDEHNPALALARALEKLIGEETQ